MIERDEAVAAVAASDLFDEEWYAAQVGADFSSRAEAAAAYVDGAATTDVSPHVLFEPTWVYPAGAWRRSAPDPLSHFLARADRGRLSTHPLLMGSDDARLDRDAARGAAFAALAGEPVGLPRSGPLAVSVVVPVVDRFRPTLQWLRRLHRTHARDDETVEVVVVPRTDADRRMAALIAHSLPGTRVGGPDEPVRGAVTVRIDDPSLEPPAWPWLHHLVARLEDPAVGRVGPLLVERDQTVVAAAALPGGDGPVPFLRGETPADAARMAHLPVPELWPGVVAFRTADGPRDPAYVVPDARVVSGSAGGEPVGPPAPRPTEKQDLWRAAGFEAPGRPLRVVEDRPALRWAIDIAAPLAPRGRRWGDDPFARSLAAALERLGQWVTVDHPETRARASRSHDDVVLVIRGLEPVSPTTADAAVATRLLWVISHPAEVTAAECAPYDVVLAASHPWAADRTAAWGREVRPLLQCTDSARFHPGLAEADSGPEVLFVGNSRGADRPVVRGALDAGLPLTLYGDGWEPPVVVAARHVPNDELGVLYASAGVVLSDHWADMRAHGFVSNRTFDVLATGGRLFSDDVPGLRELLADVGTTAPTWTAPSDLAVLARPGWRDAWPRHSERLRAAERVVAEHSFDARARALLDAVLERSGSGG